MMSSEKNRAAFEAGWDFGSTPHDSWLSESAVYVAMKEHRDQVERRFPTEGERRAYWDGERAAMSRNYGNSPRTKEDAWAAFLKGG